ncbi:MAG: hypothetical protein V4636_15710 [Pseudomonadota bacterium]
MTTRSILAMTWRLPASQLLLGTQIQTRPPGTTAPAWAAPLGDPQARTFVSHELMERLAQTRFNQSAPIDTVFSLQKPADCMVTSQKMHQALTPAASEVVRPLRVRHPCVSEIEDHCRSGPAMLTVYGLLASDQGGHAAGYPFHHAVVVLDVIRVGPDARPVAIVIDPNDLQRNPVMDALVDVIGKHTLDERIRAADTGQPLWSLLSRDELERVDARLQQASTLAPLSRGQLPYRALDLVSLIEASDTRFEALRVLNRRAPLAIRLATPQITTSIGSQSAFSDDEKAALAHQLAGDLDRIERFEVRPDDMIPLADGTTCRLADGLALVAKERLRADIHDAHPLPGMFD